MRRRRRRWGTSGGAAAYIQSAHTRIKEERALPGATGGRQRADRKTRLSDCLPQSHNPTWMMTEIMNDDDNGEWPTNNQLSGGAGGGLCLSVLQLDSFADAAAVLPSHLETFEIRRATDRRACRRSLLVLLGDRLIHRLCSKNRYCAHARRRHFHFSGNPELSIRLPSLGRSPTHPCCVIPGISPRHD